MPEIVVESLQPYKILYDLPTGTNLIILIGGRGSGKTYEASKWIAFQSCIKKKRCVILRDEKSLIRESILNEVLLRYDTANESGILDRYYQKLETGIKDLKTTEMLVFTKGFRASQTDKKANLKSISNIDYGIIEEMEDIVDPDRFNTLVDGIRNEGSIVVVILNTPDVGHFIIKRYFTLERVEDGYYDIIPKQLPGLVVIKTSFEDNPYMPVNVVDNYNNYGNPASHLYNKHYYLTAIKGYASTGRKGQIFSNWKPITNQEFNEIEARSIFGQDFGSASPAGLVECKIVNSRLYVRQHNYKGLTEKQIAYLYCELGIKDEVIIADSAEPMTIRQLRAGWEVKDLTEAEQAEYKRDRAPGENPWRYAQITKGWNIFGPIKPQGSINAGIKKLMDFEVFVTEDSTDLWAEYSAYVWATDKNKNPIDEPEDDNNHLIDAMRMVVLGKGRFY